MSKSQLLTSCMSLSSGNEELEPSSSTIGAASGEHTCSSGYTDRVDPLPVAIVQLGKVCGKLGERQRKKGERLGERGASMTQVHNGFVNAPNVRAKHSTLRKGTG